ncbi:hypothetical protein N7468_008882 [Penicillium chermesinum]|uniref:Uncharacterized protein n=1 Tax=Penicillium chermesinum TaxID=63820 RepID=A0A9W9TEH0_9EURO|nr:uncharacterized protein N7468_008882 [Penicillium chermesinum]KAJ5219678.1 hypothetical protein N7468_008882 [Penicillium chermesinum]
MNPPSCQATDTSFSPHSPPGLSPDPRLISLGLPELGVDDSTPAVQATWLRGFLPSVFDAQTPLDNRCSMKTFAPISTGLRRLLCSESSGMAGQLWDGAGEQV